MRTSKMYDRLIIYGQINNSKSQKIFKNKFSDKLSINFWGKLLVKGWKVFYDDLPAEGVRTDDLAHGNAKAHHLNSQLSVKIMQYF